MLCPANADTDCFGTAKVKCCTAIGFFRSTSERYAGQSVLAVVASLVSRPVAGASRIPDFNRAISISNVLPGISRHGNPGITNRATRRFKRALPTKQELGPGRATFMLMRIADNASLTFAFVSEKCSSIDLRLHVRRRKPWHCVFTHTRSACIFSETSEGKFCLNCASKHGLAA